MDKQQEILKAALALFVEHGFHGTPTSMIAKQAGVANGTLFHYYKTKDELITALYVAVKKQMTDCAAADGMADLPLKETCRQFYTNALNWGLDNSTEFRFLQQFMNSPYATLLPDELKAQSHAWIELIKAGIKAKQINPLPVDYITSILSSHLFGVNQYITNANLSAQARKRIIAESFDMVWGMIAA
ncbi:TetR/AcrR family transcriptional regulator [Nemorincola caseinilytica]|uniref:TetR/AcrR family transcriptional regulator n=1 Tax=Nemorincola caseinilytica TaxID=2054315 RepID=A0ABP8NK26_9BACT